MGFLRLMIAHNLFKGKVMDILKMFDKYMKEEQKDATNPGAFLKGETDAITGNPAKRNCCDDYYRGYSARHVLEQMLTEGSSR